MAENTQLRRYSSLFITRDERETVLWEESFFVQSESDSATVREARNHKTPPQKKKKSVNPM